VNLQVREFLVPRGPKLGSIRVINLPDTTTVKENIGGDSELAGANANGNFVTLLASADTYYAWAATNTGDIAGTMTTQGDATQASLLKAGVERRECAPPGCGYLLLKTGTSGTVRVWKSSVSEAELTKGW
jgi:hypothetical protein